MIHALSVWLVCGACVIIGTTLFGAAALGLAYEGSENGATLLIMAAMLGLTALGAWGILTW